MVQKLFDKKILGGAAKTEIMPKQKLLKELHKPIMIKFEKQHSSFIESSWGADLADMQLISKFNKGF